MIIRKLAPDCICTFATQRCYPLSTQLCHRTLLLPVCPFLIRHILAWLRLIFLAIHHIHVIHIFPALTFPQSFSHPILNLSHFPRLALALSRGQHIFSQTSL